jgi:hypothetical protein
MSHRGDSGINQTPTPTITEEQSWSQIGIRKAYGLSHFAQPYMVQLAIMDPSHL